MYVYTMEVGFLFIQPNPQKVICVFLCTVVAAPTATSPQSSSLRRGFQCAALRLQDESKSDKHPSSSSTTYHDHNQAESANQDTEAPAKEDSTFDPAAAEEASRPNTRSDNKKITNKRSTLLYSLDL